MPGRPGPLRTPPAPGRPRRAAPNQARPRSLRLADAVPGLIKHLPQHTPWLVTLSVIAVVVVISTCGWGSYLLLRDDSSVVGATPTPTQEIPRRDITSRKVDPTPLTADDVFPSAEIAVGPSIPPYRRAGDVQVVKNCRLAATADLGKLLVSLGCNQVVRATFHSPDGAYLITAGVFNLKDNAAAAKVNDQVAKLVDAGRGRLGGYISTSKAKILGRAPTQLIWDVQGHFLLYAVIARANGKEFIENDPQIPVIRYDIVDRHLRDFVIAEWSIDRTGQEPSSSDSPTPSL